MISGGGIRTLETPRGPLVYETSALSRSATPPYKRIIAIPAPDITTGSFGRLREPVTHEIMTGV
jgi:hypothetical protein